MQPSSDRPELSRPLSIDKIPLGGMEEHIVASPAEREALAKRLGLPSVHRFEADLNIDLAEGKMIAVTGSFDAQVVQVCVVSLEPFRVHLIDRIDTLFAPPSFFKRPPGDGGALDADPEGPEPLMNGEIDLGELVVQHLALALDPYPKKPGVVFESAKEAPVERAKPFANLADLLKKKQTGEGDV